MSKVWAPSADKSAAEKDPNNTVSSCWFKTRVFLNVWQFFVPIVQLVPSLLLLRRILRRQSAAQKEKRSAQQIHPYTKLYFSQITLLKTQKLITRISSWYSSNYSTLRHLFLGEMQPLMWPILLQQVKPQVSVQFIKVRRSHRWEKVEEKAMLVTLYDPLN